MLQFLCLVLFRDVTMTKRLMWSNLDIRRRPLVHTIVVAIRLWVFNFSFQFNYFYFHHSLVNVIERRINFVEWGPVQFLSVDWRTGDVEPANSSHSVWSKRVLSISQLQVLGSPTTESTSNDRWGEGGSNYSMCQPPTFVQMRILFWWKYWFYIHDIGL
jgi:hypothetical protein